MRNWNYRVLKFHDKESGEDFYGIHEVHYEDGKVVGVSETPAKATAENPIALGWVLDMFKQALEKPILDSETVFDAPKE